MNPSKIQLGQSRKLGAELLESRISPSISITDSEPNNSFTQYQLAGEWIGSDNYETFVISGDISIKINDDGEIEEEDRDFFGLNTPTFLQAETTIYTNLRLTNSQGKPENIDTLKLALSIQDSEGANYYGGSPAGFDTGVWRLQVYADQFISGYEGPDTIKLSYELTVSPSFVSSISTQNDIKMDDVPKNSIWSSRQPGEQSPIAASLPGNTPGLQMTAELLPSNQISERAKQIALQVYVEKLGTDGNSGFITERTIKLPLSNFLNNKYTFDLSNLIDSVGRFRILGNINLLDAEDNGLGASSTKFFLHELYVTYTIPIPSANELLSSSLLQRVTGWAGSKKTEFPRTPVEVMRSLSNSIHHQNWTYTTIGDNVNNDYNLWNLKDPTKSPQLVKQLILQPFNNYTIDCNWYAYLTGYSASLLGFDATLQTSNEVRGGSVKPNPHITISGLSGPGQGSNRRSGNASRLNPDTLELDPADRWVFNSHTWITWVDPSTGVRYTTDSVFNRTVPQNQTSDYIAGLQDSKFSTKSFDVYLPYLTGTQWFWVDKRVRLSDNKQDLLYIYQNLPQGILPVSESRLKPDVQIRYNSNPTGRDPDLQGRFAGLDFEMEISGAAGDYEVIAYLHTVDTLITSRSHYLSSASNHYSITLATDESQTISFRFSGEDIARSLLDGPYTIAIQVYQGNDTWEEFTFTTPTFRHTDFQEIDGSLSNVVTIYALSDDKTSLSDIGISATIEVARANTFNILALLYDSDNQLLSSVTTTNSLTDSRRLSLQFPIDELTFTNPTDQLRIEISLVTSNFQLLSMQNLLLPSGSDSEPPSPPVTPPPPPVTTVPLSPVSPVVPPTPPVVPPPPVAPPTIPVSPPPPPNAPIASPPPPITPLEPVVPIMGLVPQFAITGIPDSPGIIQVFDPDGTQKQTITAFTDIEAPGFVRTTLADTDEDGIPDIIAGPGPGGIPVVRIFDGSTGALIRSIDVFEPTFMGGLYLASGDISGDGIPDLGVSADVGGGTRIRLFDGKSGALLADFFGIEDAGFRGGSRIALGDLNNDGIADLIVGAGTGGGPRVAIWDGKSLRPNQSPERLVDDFFVMESSFRGGLFVAVGDVDGDGLADLVTGAGVGGGPRVFIVDGLRLVNSNGTDLLTINDFLAANADSRDGAQVAVKNLDADRFADVIVSVDSSSDSRVKAFAGKQLSLGFPPDLENDLLMEPIQGIFVG